MNEKFRELVTLQSGNTEPVIEVSFKLECDAEGRDYLYHVYTTEDENTYRLVMYVLLRSKPVYVEVAKGMLGYCADVLYSRILGFQSGLKIIEDGTLGRYKRMAELLALIHFYGDFVPETVNEKELDSILNTLGYRFEDEDALLGALPDDLRRQKILNVKEGVKFIKISA